MFDKFKYIINFFSLLKTITHLNNLDIEFFFFQKCFFFIYIVLNYFLYIFIYF